MKIRLRYWVIFIVSILLVGILASSISKYPLGLEPMLRKPTGSLRVGVVQMDIRPTIEDNCEYIIKGIHEAAKKNVRVVVFPESILSGIGADDQNEVGEALESIRQAATISSIYVMFGADTYSKELKRITSWMLVVGPDGKDVFRYEKIYSNRNAPVPGVFQIDSIPCSAILCADRWLRAVQEIPIQQGAKISFELSSNFEEEWVGPLQWYWYVPRALRNNVWVVFANTGNKVTGFVENDSLFFPRHGHSAIIAPDGSFAARSPNNRDTIMIVNLDLSRATRKEAIARSIHPALKGFWEAGKKIQSGQEVDALPFTPFTSEVVDMTIAVSQTTGSIPLLEKAVKSASDKNADLVVFPERSFSDTLTLRKIEAIAKSYKITIVIGMERPLPEGKTNSAFVVGPDGSVLTCYDQLSAEGAFSSGSDPSFMWFWVKGVPAVVTIGRDALWTELSELTAVAGAQVHVHLENDQNNSKEHALRRLQVWANMASFRTLTAVANVCGSTIWEDFHYPEEAQAVKDGTPRPNIGEVEIYSPWSANLIVQAEKDPLIVATRKVLKTNPFHPGQTSRINHQMENWYRIGANTVLPKRDDR